VKLAVFAMLVPQLRKDKRRVLADIIVSLEQVLPVQ
jgi:hypothetical protein